MSEYDAVIVGSGPNGFAAAITLARAGRKVLILEAKPIIGGGLRTSEDTLPGFHHDICATIHALGIASPFFRSVPLNDYGLEWIFPPSELAHPLDDGTAIVLERSIEATARQLGVDETTYKRLMLPLVDRCEQILYEFLGPLRFPRYPFTMILFGAFALFPANLLAKILFKNEGAQALFAGLSAHAIQPLDHLITASFALMLGILGHSSGWPLARGGSQNIANALATYFTSLGGEIVTDYEVKTLANMPSAPIKLFDVTPRQLLRIAGDALPVRYRNQLEGYRYGPGVFKIDFALSDPIPWRAEACARAGTVHLGGTLEEIRHSEYEIWHGHHPQQPLILLTQPTLFDRSRAPAGKHIAWAYCHVPHGSTEDMTAAIEGQIERFAPGFRDCILARHTRHAMAMEAYNPNYIGGDINGGVQDLRQLFTRPVLRAVPYSTPIEGVFICSSATPPGGGVHGMSGYFAAQAALTTRLEKNVPPG